jgi:hypothetical protein
MVQILQSSNPSFRSPTVDWEMYLHTKVVLQVQ